MTIDKKTIVIAVQLAIIVVLAFLLFRPDGTDSEKEDAYLKQLIEQNQQLEQQLDRLKMNYIQIGLADSLQTKSIDSLIAVSVRKISDVHKQVDESRRALEEMKNKRWDKLSETQIDKEIQDAINFLSKNEN